MKIVHLCRNDSGGAGIAAGRLHKGLKSLGIDSSMLVVRKNAKDGDTEVFTIKNSFLRKLMLKQLNRRITGDFDKYSKTRPQGLELFTDDRTLFEIERHPLIKNADIINLHWISKMVNFSTFFPALNGKPLVWTLHDMNPFTGGCHYTGHCRKYETECSQCPQLGSTEEKDLSWNIMTRKKRAYSSTQIHCVCPSTWLAECVGKSHLLGNFDIDVIPNGLQLSKFSKNKTEEARNRLGLPTDKTLLMFGAEDATNTRKGSKHIIEALNLLKKNIDTSKIAAVVFGQKSDNITARCDVQVCSLGYVEQSLMPSLYTAVDVFIVPSLEDNLPNTIMEAMASGIPVIGFRAGGIPDMIKDKKTGLLADVANSTDLYKKIKWIINNPVQRKEIGKQARQMVTQEFSVDLQAERYCRLYKKILSHSLFQN